MSIRPYRFSVAAYIASTLFASLTSALTKKASRHSDAVFSPASCPTSATHTPAPSAENSSAASRPMPPAAPVITATLPSSLPTLEEPFAFVTRDHLVELRLLGARVVQVVVDHVVAERLPRHRPVLQGSNRIAKRMGESLDIGFIRVAFERGPKVQLLLDPVEAGRDQGSNGQVRVYVCSRDARFGAQMLAVTNDPETARPVVMAPGKRGRRPRRGRVSLVRVDVRRQEDGDLGGTRDVPRQVALERVRLAVEGV